MSSGIEASIGKSPNRRPEILFDTVPSLSLVGEAFVRRNSILFYPFPLYPGTHLAANIHCAIKLRIRIRYREHANSGKARFPCIIFPSQIYFPYIESPSSSIYIFFRFLLFFRTNFVDFPNRRIILISAIVLRFYRFLKLFVSIRNGIFWWRMLPILIFFF